MNKSINLRLEAFHTVAQMMVSSIQDILPLIILIELLIQNLH